MKVEKIGRIWKPKLPRQIETNEILLTSTLVPKVALNDLLHRLHHHLVIVTLQKRAKGNNHYKTGFPYVYVYTNFIIVSFSSSSSKSHHNSSRDRDRDRDRRDRDRHKSSHHDRDRKRHRESSSSPNKSHKKHRYLSTRLTF